MVTQRSLTGSVESSYRRCCRVPHSECCVVVFHDELLLDTVVAQGSWLSVTLGTGTDLDH